MKKILIGLLLSAVTLTSFSAIVEDKNRIFPGGVRSFWIFKDGYASNPPFASIWTGVNVKGKDYSSTKTLVAFNCKLRQFRFEAVFRYSLPDNNGEVLQETYDPSPWRPVEPDGFFNYVYKVVCYKASTATHPN